MSNSLYSTANENGNNNKRKLSMLVDNLYEFSNHKTIQNMTNVHSGNYRYTYTKMDNNQE